MNKLILSFLPIAACLLPQSGQAEVVRMSTDSDYQIFAVSANGLWGVGMQGDGTGDMFTFRWNLQSNEIELSNVPAYCGTSISDDGTYCGGYAVTDNIGRTTVKPGYFDGTWHELEVPGNLNVIDALDGSITPDGRTMAITLEANGKLVPAVWRDGVFQYTLPGAQNDDTRVYCLSDDGTKAGGWTMTYNRQSCYWIDGGDCTLFDDYKAMFAEALHFSTDGKWLLWYGGWDSIDYEEGVIPSIYGLYNLETGEKKTFKALTDRGESFSVHAITDDMTVIGEYGDDPQPVLIKDGETILLNDWLKENYALDLNELPELQTMEGGIYVFRGQAISRDGKTIGIVYYGNDNLMHSMVIRLEANFENPAPIAFQASQVAGVRAAHLQWKAPYGLDAAKIKGYNVYRFGKLIADNVQETEFYDGYLDNGTFNYEVSLVTQEGESERVKTSVDINDRLPEAPQGLYARQKGYSGAAVEWNAPETNLIDKRYYDPESVTEGFGATQTDITMETAILFKANEMAMYDNNKITAVSFYPMSLQRNMAVTLYSRAADGKLTKILTKNVSNRDIELGVKNTVTFDTPIAIPTTDLVVAVAAKVVDENTSTSVFGMEWGSSIPGKSDLLRRVMMPEEDFQSMKDMGAEVGIPMTLSWKIDLILTPDNTGDDIDNVSHYEIQGQRADATSFTIGELPEGMNEIGVTAVYADGRKSPEAKVAVDIKPQTEKAPAIDVETVAIATHDGEFTASWEQPMDNDETVMAFHHGQLSSIAVTAPAENNYNLVAGVMYPVSMLRTYDGYELKSIRFYPMCDATFTLLVNRDDEQIVEQEVEDYTLGQWNTVMLDEPVIVEPGIAYPVFIDCYDVEPEGAPLGVERGTAVNGLSDLIYYGGSVWDTLEGATAIPLSWLIDAKFVAPEEMAYPSPLYNFYVAGAPVNRTFLTEPSITADVVNGGAQPYKVGVTYPGATEKLSAERTFDFGVVGVEEVLDNADTRADVFNLQGMRVLHNATRDQLPNLPAGIYIIAGEKVVVK